MKQGRVHELPAGAFEFLNEILEQVFVSRLKRNLTEYDRWTGLLISLDDDIANYEGGFARWDYIFVGRLGIVLLPVLIRRIGLLGIEALARY
jgi:hypothetical protein